MVRERRLVSVAIAAIGGVALVVAHVVNPARDHWLPGCPFHAATGLWCPACGSTRSACALARGDVVEALRHNVLFLPAVAVLVWAWVAYTLRAAVPGAAARRWAQSPFTVLRRPAWLFGLGVAILAFWVCRNVPGAMAHLLSR
jgi:hypothetical protein